MMVEIPESPIGCITACKLTPRKPVDICLKFTYLVSVSLVFGCGLWDILTLKHCYEGLNESYVGTFVRNRSKDSLLTKQNHWLGVDGGGLSYNFYEQSCPQAEDIVRDAMRAVFMADPAAPPALLRLMFHDCQVQGCDASILVDEDANGVQITSEITAARNFGVRNRDSISYAKSLLESQCPGQVSCSDVIIMAARDAVAFSGGPLINVPLGRRDSSNIPSSAVADSSIPPPNIQVGDMLRLFAKKGMTTEESVAIIGAHTIGATHCVNLMNRLYRSDRPSTDGMNPAYELMLRSACPRFSLTPNISIVANDLTMVTFDNHYYRSLMAGQGALAIDTAMASDPRTAPFVARFASDQDQFFNAFSSAFVKLSYSNVLTGNQGVIRENCARM